MDFQCDVHVYNILVTGFIVLPMYARKICKLTHLTSTKLELNFMNYEKAVMVWRSSTILVTLVLTQTTKAALNMQNSVAIQMCQKNGTSEVYDQIVHTVNLTA